MKKQIFAVLAAIMVLAMGTTVFAAASPEDEAGYSEFSHFIILSYLSYQLYSVCRDLSTL